MADSKQGAGLSSGSSSAAVHKANSLMNRKQKKKVLKGHFTHLH